MGIVRSFSSTKALAASVLNRVSISLTRRGYVTSAEQQGVASTDLGKGGSTTHTVAGKAEESPTSKQGSVKPSSSWGPDPVTGYYKPSDQVTEVDAVDLREIHHKVYRLIVNRDPNFTNFVEEFNGKEEMSKLGFGKEHQANASGN